MKQRSAPWRDEQAEFEQDVAIDLPAPAFVRHEHENAVATAVDFRQRPLQHRFSELRLSVDPRVRDRKRFHLRRERLHDCLVTRTAGNENYRPRVSHAIRSRGR
jgi:hypothetical protein